MLDKLPSGAAVSRTGAEAGATALAVLIVGMHRSGTSAISGVLNLLGVATPADLFGADEHNPKGYFEPLRVIDFHEALLAKLGSSSDDPLPLGSAWLDSPVGEAAVEALADLIEEETAGEALCLFKDPRMCRLMPLWTRALERLGREAVVVLPSRHPLEVAGSLQAKGLLPRAHALLWWLEHTLAAEHDTRGLRRSFTLYDETLGDWRTQVERVGRDLRLTWPRDPARRGSEIDTFLSGELRHHRAPAAELEGDPLHHLCGRVWGALQDLVRDPAHAGAKAELDAVRAELDKALPLAGPVLAAYHQKLAWREGQLHDTHAHAVALTGSIEEHRKVVADQSKALEEHVEALNIREGRALRAERAARLERTKAERLKTRVDETAAASRDYAQRMHAADAALRAVQASGFWRISGPVRRTLTRHPGLRRGLGNAARLTWWTLTLQLGRRLRVAPAEPAPNDVEDALTRVEWRTTPKQEPRLRVVFVSGEPDTPGHLYRVVRYADAARAVGAEVVVTRLDQVADVREAIASADVVFVWRAPWDGNVELLRDAAAAGDTPMMFDVDDLMFEPDMADVSIIDGIRSQNLEEDEVRRFYERVQGTLGLCSYASAPTPFLAQRLRLQDRPAFVLPNGFDEAVYQRSRLEARLRRSEPSDGLVRIGYASGSRTHQKDFAQTVGAIARVLRERPKARLVLFKSQWEPVLDPAEFPVLDGLHDRIEWEWLAPIEDLPAALARFDISIAPVEVDNPFCEAKSELKFFEAALVDVPTVASPTEPFRDAIRHGENGLLAHTEDEWYAALISLVDDPARRRALARNALYDTLADYGPERRAERLLSVLEQVARGPRRAARAFELELARTTAGPRPRPHVPANEVVFESDRMRPAEVTVIVPLYNYAGYVIEALDSVKAQSLAEIDLVVVNDASTDASEQVALDWMRANAERFGRVLLVRNTPNAGLGFSRNVGFDQAETLYVLPLDADNRLRTDYAEKALAEIKRSGAAFVYPLIRHFGDDEALMGYQSWSSARLTAGNFIDAMALVRRAAWADVGGYDHVRFGWEDYDFWLRLVERGWFAAQLPEELADYRVHGASMLRSATDLRRNKLLLLADMTRRHPWVRLEPPPEAKPTPPRARRKR